MEKSYYMSPVNKLIDLILTFVENPKKYRGEFAFGTPMPISRSQLLSNEFPENDKIYREEMKQTKDIFNIEVSNEDIKHLGKNAKDWVQSFTN